MSKTAEKIAQHLTAKGWGSEILWWADAKTAAFRVNLVAEIDAALEGKIISKMELSALRTDAMNMAEAQKAYNYADGLNIKLQKQIQEWKVVANEKENEYIKEYEDHTKTVSKLTGIELENDNLKRDIENLRADIVWHKEKAENLLGQNQKLSNEVVNLKMDMAALKAFPSINWTFGNLAEPFKWSAAAQANAYAPAKSKSPSPGKIVEAKPCDICGILEPPGAGHTHTGFEKFIARLIFWK